MKRFVGFVFSLCSFWSVLVAQNSVCKIVGKVQDTMGKGIAGVVVNDGVHFTKTDIQGDWSLHLDTMVSKFVSLSVPADCVLPQTDGLADGFYVSVREAVRKGRHDFVLEKRPKTGDSFHYIAISDPQIANEHDMYRWKTETVPDLCETVDSLKQEGGEVIGTTLGDLVFDNMNMWNEYKSSMKDMGMTVFQCIGNHDFNRQYQDLHNMETGASCYAEQLYNHYFGPTDYSYNVGKVHVVTMKDINYVGNKHFMESLTGAQLAWLKKDLSYVPKGSTVFLNFHAAAWNRVYPRGNIRNAAQLKEILEPYKVHVFCGHTHFYQNVEVFPMLYQHNIGAACGAWWGGWINRCGAPNGYLVVKVDGDNLSWHYKGTRRSPYYQFRVYKKGEFKSQSSFVVANVWDWDDACRIVWYQDGKLMGNMEQFVDADEAFASSLANRASAVPTAHLFRAMPKDGAKVIRIVWTNRFGESYEQSVNL